MQGANCLIDTGFAGAIVAPIKDLSDISPVAGSYAVVVTSDGQIRDDAMVRAIEDTKDGKSILVELEHAIVAIPENKFLFRLSGQVTPQELDQLVQAALLYRSDEWRVLSLGPSIRYHSLRHYTAGGERQLGHIHVYEHVWLPIRKCRFFLEPSIDTIGRACRPGDLIRFAAWEMEAKGQRQVKVDWKRPALVVRVTDHGLRIRAVNEQGMWTMADVRFEQVIEGHRGPHDLPPSASPPAKTPRTNVAGVSTCFLEFHRVDERASHEGSKSGETSYASLNNVERLLGHYLAHVGNGDSIRVGDNVCWKRSGAMTTREVKTETGCGEIGRAHV
jgi:hypothetical protein